MEIQLKKEKLQQLVIVSEINLYHVDENLQIKERYILYAEDRDMLEQCGRELAPIVTENIENAPIIYERENGDLIGVIKVSDTSIYLTSVMAGGSMVKMLAYLSSLPF